MVMSYYGVLLFCIGFKSSAHLSLNDLKERIATDKSRAQLNKPYIYSTRQSDPM